MDLSKEYCHGCDPEEGAGGGQHVSAAEKRAVIEWYMHAFNAYDIDGMLDQLHSDAHCLTIVDGTVTGGGEGAGPLRTYFAQESSLCSSRKKTVMEFYMRDEVVVLEISYSCVLAGNHPGGWQPGDTLIMEGVAEIRFAENKIVHLTEMYSTPQLHRSPRG